MTDQNAAEILHTGLDSLVDDAKAQQDYSAEVAELLTSKIGELEKSGRIDEAVEELLVFEKKCRQVSDGISTSKIAMKILQLLFDRDYKNTKNKKDLSKVTEMMVLLSRKRGQLRRTISDMVSLASGDGDKKGSNSWLQSMKEGSPEHTELLNCLLAITDGKIFVEVERSRLVSIQAKILEEVKGDIDGAAMLLQETQVETFSTMDKIEKSRFILNQMRLMLLRKDYVRVQIASRKISEKFLDQDADLQYVKVEYFLYMIEYYLHGEHTFIGTGGGNSSNNNSSNAKKANLTAADKAKLGSAACQKAPIPNNDGSGNFYEVTRCYAKIFNTQCVKINDSIDNNSSTSTASDKSKCNVAIPTWREVLSHWLIYLCLCKENENSVQLMNETLGLVNTDVGDSGKTSGEKDYVEDGGTKAAAHTNKLTRKELETFSNLSGLVRCFREKKLISWPLKFEKELVGHAVFKDPSFGQSRYQLLRKRVIQHNLKICSLYYSRIQTPRLMELLSLSQKELESELSALVVDGSLYARIDRPEKTIVFEGGSKGTNSTNNSLSNVKKNYSEIRMNGWSKSIENVLDLVRECGNMIGKEKMIQEARSKALKGK